MGNLFLTITIFLAGVVFNAGKPLFAQQKPLELTRDGQLDVQFTNQLSYFLDEDSHFLQNPASVLLQEFTHSAQARPLYLGYSDATLWLQFSLNVTESNVQRLILSMKQGSLNRVTLYEVQDGTLQFIARAGGSVKEHTGSYETLGIHLILGKPEPGVHHYLLQIEPMGGILESSFLLEEDQQWVASFLTTKLLAMGIFCGLFMALMISHGLTWFLTRQRVYLDYVFYAASVLVVVANFQGLLDWMMPWPAIGGWTFLSPLFSSMVGISLYLMHKNYYNADSSFPRIARTFQSLVAINIGLAMLNIFGFRRWAHILCDMQVIPATLIIFGFAYYAWKKGFHSALYLIYARFMMIFFTLIFMLKIYNVLPKNLFTDYSFHIGALLEMIIVYLGLSIRTKNLESEKVTAQENERLATVRLDWFNTLVRVITHDMATPISIISTSAELELRRQQPSSSLKKNLERIQRAVDQQSDLVGHVREMIAVTMGKKTLNCVPIHLQKKMEGLLLNYAERIESKGLKVQLKMPDQPLYVLAEATAIEHTILGNLMSNAIKFSQKDGVIHLNLQREKDEIIIRFEDFGVGIPAELLNKLFDPTQATSRPGTQNEPGTGFGLPLAKVYVEQFNGIVTVRTQVAAQPGQPSGTIFELRFPAIEADSSIAEERFSA